MAEGDGTGESARLPGPRQVAVLRRLVQQIQHPLRRGHRGLQVAEEFRRLPDGAGELAGVQHEGGQRPQGQPASQIQQGAKDADGRQGQVVDQIDGGAQGRAGTVGPVVGLGGGVVFLGELPEIRRLHSIDPNGPLAADPLLRKAVQGPQLLGAAAEQRVDVLHLEPRQQDGERHGHEEHAGEQGREHQQHPEGADDRQQAGADLEEIGGQGGVDGVHIVADPADQVPCRVGVEILDRQLTDPLKGRLPQRVGHGLPHPHQGGGGAVAANSGQDSGAETCGAAPQHRGQVRGSRRGPDGLHRPARHQGHQQRQQAGQSGQRRCPRQGQRLGPQESAHPAEQMPFHPASPPI